MHGRPALAGSTACGKRSKRRRNSGYVPAYSTDLDRVDQAFRKLKMALRTHQEGASHTSKARLDIAREGSINDFGLGGCAARVK